MPDPSLRTSKRKPLREFSCTFNFKILSRFKLFQFTVDESLQQTRIYNRFMFTGAERSLGRNEPKKSMDNVNTN